MQTNVVNTEVWTRSWMAWGVGPTDGKEGSDYDVMERHDASLTQLDTAGCFLRQKSTCITRLFLRTLHKYLISCLLADHVFVPDYDTQRNANMNMMNHLIITQPPLPLTPCRPWVKQPQVQNVL
jgi:hypothetical protein